MKLMEYRSSVYHVKFSDGYSFSFIWDNNRNINDFIDFAKKCGRKIVSLEKVERTVE